LLAAVLAEDGYGVAVEADRSGPDAFGGAVDALAAYDGGGAAKGDLGRIEVEDSGGPWTHTTGDPAGHHGLDIIRALTTEWEPKAITPAAPFGHASTGLYDEQRTCLPRQLERASLKASGEEFLHYQSRARLRARQAARLGTAPSMTADHQRGEQVIEREARRNGHPPTGGRQPGPLPQSAGAHRRGPLLPRGQPRTPLRAVPPSRTPVTAPARANRAVLPRRAC
jgi:hypothetical protein